MRPTAFLTGERSNVRDSNRYKNIRAIEEEEEKKKKEEETNKVRVLLLKGL